MGQMRRRGPIKLPRSLMLESAHRKPQPPTEPRKASPTMAAPENQEQIRDVKGVIGELGGGVHFVPPVAPLAPRGRWLALTAALLGWMFDGLEMGLFPLVGRSALNDLLPTADPALKDHWFNIAIAVFLVGAATGGVVFGWLGDRIGRVRAMTLSVLTYALFSGACGLAQSIEQVVVLRFVASLGMGGEWSLGVALVMEIWPNRSRALLAGMIGAAANLGYMLIAVLGLILAEVPGQLHEGLLAVGLPEGWVRSLTAHQGWRFLMLLGAVPALLTFFIRLWVPESERWLQEKGKGGTSNWATRDLLGVCVGSAAACLIIYLWSDSEPNWAVAVSGSLLALLVVIAGYLYPIIRYLQRSEREVSVAASLWSPTVRRMLLAACLSGVALLGTWASMQKAPKWAGDKFHDVVAESKSQRLSGKREGEAPAEPPASAKAGSAEASPSQNRAARIASYTQMWSALGAIAGTILGALLGDWIGRRKAYVLLCLGSLGATLLFYQGTGEFGFQFLACAFLAGGLTASFYGWLPLYLPELFHTNVRAIGQGFAFNFGRIIAAIGALQGSNLMRLFPDSDPTRAVARACSIMASVYLVGVVIIWLAPETRGQPLPE
jgi:MFS transporter, SHS family, sialic acid transporter